MLLSLQPYLTRQFQVMQGLGQSKLVLHVPGLSVCCGSLSIITAFRKDVPNLPCKG